MSVHQIEQYYIHVDLTDCSDQKREEIKELLLSNDIFDAEFTDTDLTVDDFDSGAGADSIDDMITNILR
tara:strand:- start:41037 stop:41243 length:207 start_codon:yes stop_codon:yes gene_type:complete